RGAILSELNGMATEFNTALGLRPGEDPGALVLDPRPEHQVAPDVVHFAVLTALAEIAAARAVGRRSCRRRSPCTFCHGRGSPRWWARAGCCVRANGWRSPRAR